ncbi:MAG: cytochrome c family protein [Marinibacterium sp.]|nr:cytochrome c family protein [Marinibacterium sp.]
MLDTMTFTKVAASLCGALLVFLLGKWAAEVMYHVDGHGEQAYIIETDSDEGGDSADEEVAFVDLLATADVGKGERVFKKCAACHKVEDGANSTGPYLFGVVDRDIGTAAGFGYSSAMAGHGGAWDADALNAFLTKPSAYVPGTSMSFSGLKKVQDRANLVAYLSTLSN